ncbi:CD63 antigen-like, partial [Fopius arisanus]|uniref:CD63 antigen-like n=1 Tax=Fopius arisanus TaxID=64838 RepID=A0A9R1TNY5_9HYME
LCGLALLILGVLVETNLGSVKAETADQIHQIEVIAIGLIVIGSIIFVIAFFGCCGAIRESHCMTVTYAVFLLVILVIQVGIAIWAFVVLKNLNTAEMTEEFKKPLTKYWINNLIFLFVFQLVGIIFALCLANSIRNEDRRNYRV